MNSSNHRYEAEAMLDVYDETAAELTGQCDAREYNRLMSLNSYAERALYHAEQAGIDRPVTDDDYALMDSINGNKRAVEQQLRKFRNRCVRYG